MGTTNVHFAENLLKILINLKKLCKKVENMKVFFRAIMNKEEDLANIVFIEMNDFLFLLYIFI